MLKFCQNWPKMAKNGQNRAFFGQFWLVLAKFFGQKQKTGQKRARGCKLPTFRRVLAVCMAPESSRVSSRLIFDFSDFDHLIRGTPHQFRKMVVNNSKTSFF